MLQKTLFLDLNSNINIRKATEADYFRLIEIENASFVSDLI